MACNITVSGRSFPCKDKIGTVSNGAISDAASAITVYGFELTKNTGSFQQTVTSSVENGTVFFSQVVELTMPNLVADDNEELYDLLKSRLCVIVQDNNDNYMIMGHTTGAEATGGTIGTGTAKGDLNGYQIQLTAEEAIPAPFLTTITGGNVTFEAGS